MQKLITFSIIFLWLGLPARADDDSWTGKTVILARAGVELTAPDGEDTLPRVAGLAKEFVYYVKHEKNGRLRIQSRRQDGWIDSGDVVPFDRAIDFFTDRIADDPRDSHAYTARGTAFASMNELDKAVADFSEAIRLDPKAAQAYHRRADIAYMKQKSEEYDKALADYNEAIRLDPGDDWAYHVRGWIYYRRKDYDKALADYETAIKLVPKEAVFYRDRGNIALVREEYDKALADYSTAIELQPTYSVPWLQRARTWTAKKEYAHALADYEMAVEVSSTETPPYPMSNTALAVFLAGCPDDTIRNGKRALEAARKACELGQGAEELAALAAAHAELGEFDKAVDSQTKAVDAAPSESKPRHLERLQLYKTRKPYRL
jgi:tetratricopeptide (TPR) repeat protein